MVTQTEIIKMIQNRNSTEALQLLKTLRPEALSAIMNSVARDGKTLLHHAVMCQCLEVVEYLLERKAPVNQADRDGAIPLHCAAKVENVDIAKKLLEYSSEINATDIRGITPLYLMVCRGDPYIKGVELLLSYGADCNIAAGEDSNGDTPLHRAAYYGFPLILERLINHGANVNSSNDEGNTALHCLVDGGNDFLPVPEMDIMHGLNVEWSIEKAKQCAEILFFHGVNSKLKNHDEQTAYQMADSNDVKEILTTCASKAVVKNTVFAQWSQEASFFSWLPQEMIALTSSVLFRRKEHSVCQQITQSNEEPLPRSGCKRKRSPDF